MFYENGDIYDGDYKNDKREGKGIFNYSNGEIEMGNFVNGRNEGRHLKLHVLKNLIHKFIKY